MFILSRWNEYIVVYQLVLNSKPLYLIIADTVGIKKVMFYQSQSVAGYSDMWIADISYKKAMVIPKSLGVVFLLSNLYFIPYHTVIIMCHIMCFLMVYVTIREILNCFRKFA